MNDGTLEQVRFAAGKLLNMQIDEIVPLAIRGSGNKTFRVVTAHGAVVAKTNDKPGALSRSTHNLRVLTDLGVPVPRVLAWDESTTLVPFAVLVMTEIRGRDLAHELPSMSKPQMSDLAKTIVGFQRVVGELPHNEGFGFVGIGEPATRTWSDVVRRPNTFRWADPLPGDTRELHDRLYRDIERAEHYFESVEPVCFLDDLTTKNVMVENGTLAGVVDFDVVCYGDPLFHLGLCAAAVVVDTGGAGSYYIDELIRFSDLSDSRRAITGLYTAVFLTNFLGAEWPSRQGEWRTRAIIGANAGLDKFERRS